MRRWALLLIPLSVISLAVAAQHTKSAEFGGAEAVHDARSSEGASWVVDSDSSAGGRAPCGDAPIHLCGRRPGIREAEDPWEPLPLDARSESAPRQEQDLGFIIMRRAHRLPEGGVAIRKHILIEPSKADRSHAVYDLSALAPDPNGWNTALIGQCTNGVRRPGRERWWTWLAQAIMARVGEGDWPAENTLLAWDPDGEVLVVRHHERALTAVESVLDEIEDLHREVVPLTLRFTEIGAKTAVATLTLDVPWHRTTRALCGTEWPYLMDYDIEVSNEFIVTDAIWGVVECGLGVCVVRRPSEHADAMSFDIEVASCEEAPTFRSELVEMTHAGRSLLIELPLAEARSWQGSVSAVPGSRLELPLPGDVRCELEVGEPLLTRRPSQRTWRRVSLFGSRRDPAMQRAEIGLTVSGVRSGRIAHGRLLLTGTRQRAYVSLRKDSVAWEVSGYASSSSPLSLAAYAEVNLGRIDIEVTPCGSPAAAGAIDVELRLSEWTGDVRLVEVSHTDLMRFRGSQHVDLPSTRSIVTHRRVMLSPTGAGSLEFAASVGRGPEMLTLTVQRTPLLPHASIPTQRD